MMAVMMLPQKPISSAGSRNECQNIPGAATTSSSAATMTKNEQRDPVGPDHGSGSLSKDAWPTAANTGAIKPPLPGWSLAGTLGFDAGGVFRPAQAEGRGDGVARSRRLRLAKAAIGP